MSAHDDTITRRDFLRGAAGLTFAAATGLGFDISAEEKPRFETRVVLIRDNGVFDKKGKINQKVINRMLDDAVVALFDGKDVSSVWKKLIGPKDLVGIKSNDWAPLATPPEVEQILRQRVLDVGVPDKNIAIGDRDKVREDPVFRKATALINVRPLRTHHWSGVGSCIKNYISFVKVPSDYHDEFCSPLGSIWNLPQIKGKTRLNILLVLQPLFHGIGPHHYDRSYTWRYCGILMGTDPVAIDTVGVHLFDAKRREFFKEDRPLTPPAIHIARADKKYGIGTSDLKKIELVKLGWKDGILI